MDNKTDQSNKAPINTSDNKTLNSLATLAVISVIIGAIGVGFGVYGTIQSNRAISIINNSGLFNDSDDEEDDAAIYNLSKPASADSINFVSVRYNEGFNYADIYDDNEIAYYTDDEEDTEDFDDNYVEADTKTIMKYIFDHVVEHVEPQTIAEEYEWSIEIESEEGISSIGGNDEVPEWFNDLLKELDVDAHGYKASN